MSGKIPFLYGNDGHPQWLTDAFDSLASRDFIFVQDGREPRLRPNGIHYGNGVIVERLEQLGETLRDSKESPGEWAARVAPLLVAEETVELDENECAVLLLMINRLASIQRDRQEVVTRLRRRVPT